MVYERALIRELRLRAVPVVAPGPSLIWRKGDKVRDDDASVSVDGRLIVERSSVEPACDGHLDQHTNWMEATNIPLELAVDSRHPKVEWWRISSQ